MVWFIDLIEALLRYPELGWVIVLIYLYIELRSSHGKLQRVDERIVAVTTVVRALSRVHDDIETGMVDEYLVENGQEPKDFLGPDDGRREKVDKTKHSEANPEKKRSVDERMTRPKDSGSGSDPMYKQGLGSSEEDRLDQE